MRIPSCRIAALIFLGLICIGSAVAAQQDPYDAMMQRAYTYVWFAASTQNPHGLFFHEATGLFADAAELRPDQAEPHLMAAIAYQLLGEYSLAEQHYIRAAESADDPAVWIMLADLYALRGRLDEAEKLYRQLLNDGHALVLANIGLADLAIRRQQYHEAFPYLETALAQKPYHVQGMVLLAEAYLETGEPEQALETLEPLNAAAVWYLPYHIQMARIHAALGNQEEACYFASYVLWREPEINHEHLFGHLICDEF